MGYTEIIKILDGDNVLKEYLEIRSYTNTSYHIPYNFLEYYQSLHGVEEMPIINLEVYIDYIKMINEESIIRYSKYNPETEEYDEDLYEYKYNGDAYWSLHKYFAMNEEIHDLYKKNKDLKISISFNW